LTINLSSSSRNTGGQSVNDCNLCDDGQFCQGLNNTEPTGDCDPGYYCTRGNRLPKPNNTTIGGLCPLGKFCNGRTSVPEDCPKGDFVCVWVIEITFVEAS